jgi:hypothetical protein
MKHEKEVDNNFERDTGSVFAAPVQERLKQMQENLTRHHN